MTEGPQGLLISGNTIEKQLSKNESSSLTVKPIIIIILLFVLPVHQISGSCGHTINTSGTNFLAPDQHSCQLFERKKN